MLSRVFVAIVGLQMYSWDHSPDTTKNHILSYNIIMSNFSSYYMLWSVRETIIFFIAHCLFVFCYQCKYLGHKAFISSWITRRTLRNRYAEAYYPVPGEGHGNPLRHIVEIPWTKEPDGLQSIGLQRIGHDWVTKQSCLEALQRDNKYYYYYFCY